MPALRPSPTPRRAAHAATAWSLALAAALVAGSGAALAQQPQPVYHDDLGPRLKRDARAAVQPCSDNAAGTVTIGPLTGQSNDVSPDTVFLCFGDEVVVDHNGDQRLDGDPDPSTPAGVGYIWYECRPTAEGPTRIAVEADRCLVDNPGSGPGVARYFLSTGGRLDGDLTFRNDGTVQTLFGGDDPTLIWFAPATFDALQSGGPRYEGGGSCVSVSADAAFAVVYLNEVATADLDVGDCGGAFTIAGGLPEYDARARYDVSIVNTADASLVGEVVNPEVGHGGRLRFRVPAAGTYAIAVRDAKGCAAEAPLTATVSACTPRPEVVVRVDTAQGAPGATVCLPVRATGWTALTDFGFDLAYGLPLLRYDAVQAIHPGLVDFAVTPVADRLEIRRTGSVGGPSTVPDGDVLFEVCFELLGDEGEFAPVSVEPPTGGYAFADDGGEVVARTRGGGILISAASFAVIAEGLPGCGGEDANAIEVRAFGGRAPYAVRYGIGGPTAGPIAIATEGASARTPDDLPPGTYTVEVEDRDGVRSVAEVAVADGPRLTVNIEVVGELRCRGDETGALRARPLLDFSNPGRPEDYTYRWTDAAGAQAATTQAVNGLPVGQYTVEIADARGCRATNMQTVFSPAALTSDPAVTDATCTGPADGEIAVAPAGGTTATGNYDYRITRPDATVDASRGPDLALTGDPGAYTVVVADDNGCRDTTELTVGVRREIDATAVIDSISCFRADDGVVLVTGGAAFGGAPELPFAFNWSGAPRPATNNTNTTTEASGLGPGTFVLLTTDARGCEARDTFALAEPAALVATLVERADESCDPGGDGFALVRATGGTRGNPAYDYAWAAADGAAVATDPTDAARAVGLAEGRYQVLVTDAHGCTAALADSVEIAAPAPPRIDALDDYQLACHGDADGVLEVTATGTDAPIDRYVWDNGATGAGRAGLRAGTYAVTVFDIDGCSAVDSATVFEPGVLEVADTLATAPACFRQGGGEIVLSVAGGTAPYTYEWSDGTAGVGANAIAGDAITAGAYVVTVTDANDCPAVTEVYVLAEAPSIDPDFSAFARASCATEVCDGSVTVAAVLPGTPGATFTFAWDSGEVTADATASTARRLCGGRNAVFIQESSRRCPPQEFPIDIPAPPPVLAQAEPTDVRCFGERSGRVAVTATSGGTPGYTYAWETPAGAQTGEQAIDLPAGPTYLLVRDEDGCPFRDTFLLAEPDTLTLTEDTTLTVHPTCFGYADGALVLRVAGGNTGAKTLRWNDEPTRDRAEASGLAAGTYVAQVTDRLGCQDEAEAVLTSPAAVAYALAPYDSIRCFGEFTFVGLDSAWGGTGEVLADYQVAVHGSAFRPLDERFQVPGAIPLSVRVVDPEGCEANGELIVYEPPAITARLPAAVEVALGDSIRLRPTLRAGGAPLRYDSLRWTPDSTLSFGEAGLATPVARPLTTTAYTLSVGDEDGCTAEATVLVEVDRDRDVYVPSAFSPNNDAVNDQLQVFTGPGVAAIPSVTVYNRWGELVYEALDLPTDAFGRTAGWDGTFRGRKVAAGTYVYVAEVIFLDGVARTYKGSVDVMY